MNYSDELIESLLEELLIDLAGIFYSEDELRDIEKESEQILREVDLDDRMEEQDNRIRGREPIAIAGESTELEKTPTSATGTDGSDPK